MVTNQPLKLKGVPGSPYTRKMLAYLRYRHIGYEFLIGNRTPDAMGLPKPKIDLLPTFYLPDAAGETQAVVDSTPLIRRFEQEFAGRETLPSNPVLNFLAHLIEDYADEWLSRAMFHFRWRNQADTIKAGNVLPFYQNLQMNRRQHLQAASMFSDRQISRLNVVGSNNVTAPVIEASYRRFLTLFDQIVENQTFVLGTRPSAADFGIYAQFTQLAQSDPTPMQICLDQAPRMFAWTDVVDDLSGHVCEDNGWMSVDDVKRTLGNLLTEIGLTHVPALLVNAQAFERGEEDWKTTIDGKPWQQSTFRYQVRCLQAIREAFTRLDHASQLQIIDVLKGTGCEEALP